MAYNTYDKLFMAKTDCSFLVMLVKVYLVFHKNSNYKYVITYLNRYIFNDLRFKRH